MAPPKHVIKQILPHATELGELETKKGVKKQETKQRGLALLGRHF